MNRTVDTLYHTIGAIGSSNHIAIWVKDKGKDREALNPSSEVMTTVSKGFLNAPIERFTYGKRKDNLAASFAILYDFTGDEKFAIDHIVQFAQEVLGTQSTKKPLKLKGLDILTWQKTSAR